MSRKLEKAKLKEKLEKGEITEQEYTNSLKGLKGNKIKLLDKIKETLSVYDVVIANLIAGKAIIEPDKSLKYDEISVGFSNICSRDSVSKYFLICSFPLFIDEHIVEEIRSYCRRPGVKINFYSNFNPHKINWDSPEMRNRMQIWEQFSKNTDSSASVFEYRKKRADIKNKENIVLSTRYINSSDLDYDRSTLRGYMYIKVSSGRSEEDILNLIDSIDKLKEYFGRNRIKYKELKINLIDWLKFMSPFSLKNDGKINKDIPYRVVVDDDLAIMRSYKQGAIGKTGQILGMDMDSFMPVLYHFKEDPNAPENWLIAAETGSGKSYLIKPLVFNLLSSKKFDGLIIDYEGDEYTNLGYFIKAGRSEDVAMFGLSMDNGKYFEPCVIADLTGEEEIDRALKKTSIQYIEAMYRIMVKGMKGEFSIEEKKVMSMAISQMYDEALVTEDRNTWKRSKSCRINMVYEQLKYMVENKILTDEQSENKLHKAASKIVDAASIYFEEGESKYGTFREPIEAEEVFNSKLCIISFGMKGASKDLEDPSVLALKQLCVSYLSIQKSNYCKYVKHCFNFKVWEEFQRYGEAEGSSDIILNTITGGRKRGDVNFIITNDLSKFTDKNNKLAQGLVGNVQHYILGKIKAVDTRNDFCKMFELKDCSITLSKIAKANSKKSSVSDELQGGNIGDAYKHAFCLILEDGSRALLKVLLPKELASSQIFTTGVVIK